MLGGRHPNDIVSNLDELHITKRLVTVPERAHRSPYTRLDTKYISGKITKITTSNATVTSETVPLDPKRT